MSPTPSKSLALQHVKLGDVREICDEIIFDLYPRLSHMYYNHKLKYLDFSGIHRPPGGEIT